jgi:hypothetical protein
VPGSRLFVEPDDKSRSSGGLERFLGLRLGQHARPDPSSHPAERRELLEAMEMSSSRDHWAAPVGGAWP